MRRATVRMAICDDSTKDRCYLAGKLGEYNARRCVAAHVEHFVSEQSLLRDFSPGAFDVLFLGICMAGAAKFIRQADEDVMLIITTVGAGAGVEGYGMHAARHLLRPFTDAQLADTMDWCMERLMVRVQTLDVISRRKTVTIPLSDILYIEVLGHSSVIHTFGEAVSTNSSLGKLKQAIGNAFLRSHRSYIVNMEYVLKCDGSHFILKDQQSVPIARDGAQKVKQQYLDWAADRMRGEEKRWPPRHIRLSGY